MFKYSKPLLVTYNGLQSLCCGQSTCLARSQIQHNSAGSNRNYATIKSGRDGSHHHHHHWPTPKVPGVPLTPYEIFGQKKGATYSKHRFYELVKIYHPDRHGLHDSNVTPTVRLERYRLIVAANDILSDPVKRGAYDRYGAGWNGMPDVRGARNSTTSPWDWNGAAGAGNWTGPNGPSQNATWEDWEKWRERNSGQAKQEPIFMSNNIFVVLVCLVAAVGTVGQQIRMENFSLELVEQTEAKHTEARKDLLKVRQQAYHVQGTEDEQKQQRIDMFLKRRDASNLPWLMKEGRDVIVEELKPENDIGAKKEEA